MAANILAHDHASAQGKYRAPTDIFKHFERILSKYARFSTWLNRRTSRNSRNRVLSMRETPN
jgi:hypothetical protein